MKRDELRARSRLIAANGASRLGGRNSGPYPRHHFAYDHALPPSPGWPLRIPFTGGDEWVAGCYRYRECSDICALELVEEGCFLFRQGERTYQVVPGELFLVRPGADSEMLLPESCHAAFKRTVALEGTLLEPLLASLGLDRIDVIRPADPVPLQKLFDQIAETFDNEISSRAAIRSALGCQLLFRLALDCRDDTLPAPLPQILDGLDRRLGEPLTTAKLAREAGISCSTLHRLFRKHLGDTPINILIDKRIEAARRLLSLTDQPIKEIAFRVGYGNALHFSTEFRKRTGCSPSAWRSREAGKRN